MYSSVVFLIYATGMVLARSIADVTSTDCTKDYYEKLRSTSKNGGCAPYYTHVTLEPEEGQQYSPQSVYVRRCGGYAHASAECKPALNGTQIIHVPVAVFSLNGNHPQQEQCDVAKVEEHVACKVKCKKGSEDCDGEREYDWDNCECVCKNRQERRNKCEGLKKWDDESCQCKCEAQECTSGYGWNYTSCTCQKR